MEIYRNYDVSVKITHPKHIGGSQRESTSNIEKSFGEVLLDAFDNVNKAENKARELGELAIVSPEEVNVHDIMIAEEEARLSLLFIKTVVEKGISAWRELLNLR
jgi:flagellar hook-basal body complex protein FliE